MNGDFKGTAEEWRGYAGRALEDIGKDITEVKKELKEIKVDISSHKMSIVRLKLKSGIWGVIGGVLTISVSFLISLLIGKKFLLF